MNITITLILISIGSFKSEKYNNNCTSYQLQQAMCYTGSYMVTKLHTYIPYSYILY